MLYGVQWLSGLVHPTLMSSRWDVVRILTMTMVLMSLIKMLYHNCFTLPWSKWVPVRAELVVVFLISPICAKTAAIEMFPPQGTEMVSGIIFEPDEQG